MKLNATKKNKIAEDVVVSITTSSQTISQAIHDSTQVDAAAWYNAQQPGPGYGHAMIPDMPASHHTMMINYKDVFYTRLSDPRYLTDSQISNMIMNEIQKSPKRRDILPHHWNATQVEIARSAMDNKHPNIWKPADKFYPTRTPPRSMFSNEDLQMLKNDEFSFYENRRINVFFLKRPQTIRMVEEYYRRNRPFPSHWSPVDVRYVKTVYAEERPLWDEFFKRTDVIEKIRREREIPTPILMTEMDTLNKLSDREVYEQMEQWKRDNIDPFYNNVPANWTLDDRRMAARKYNTHKQHLLTSGTISTPSDGSDVVTSAAAAQPQSQQQQQQQQPQQISAEEQTLKERSPREIALLIGSLRIGNIVHFPTSWRPELREWALSAEHEFLNERDRLNKMEEEGENLPQPERLAKIPSPPPGKGHELTEDEFYPDGRPHPTSVHIVHPQLPPSFILSGTVTDSSGDANRQNLITKDQLLPPPPQTSQVERTSSIATNIITPEHNTTT